MFRTLKVRKYGIRSFEYITFTYPSPQHPTQNMYVCLTNHSSVGTYLVVYLYDLFGKFKTQSCTYKVINYNIFKYLICV